VMSARRESPGRRAMQALEAPRAPPGRAAHGDAVASGHVATLAKAGGNITGVAGLMPS
jgi:hypothetical protein